MRRRHLLPTTFLFLAVAAVPSAAQAGTAASRTTNESDRGGDRTVLSLTFSAAPGERNDLSVAVDATGATLTDSVPITAGRNCVRPEAANPRTVRCAFRGVETLPVDDEERVEARISVGDRNDTVVVSGAFPGSSATNTVSTTRVDGGKGDDRLQSIGDTALYVGGPGDDVLKGGPGDDMFAQGPKPDGADTITGGGQAEGRGDEVSYIRRRSPIHADLAGDRDDGARGERDRIVGGVENLTGGIRSDRLTGDGQGNLIFGGAGGDVVKGGAGHDYLSVGGTKGKRDIVRARDGETDFVACAVGTQELELDGTDLFSDKRRGEGCETFKRSSAFAAVLYTGGGETVITQFVTTDTGVTALTLGCAPDGRKARCRGTVRIKIGDRVLASRSFVATDPFGFASIKLPDADRATLAAQGRLEATVVLEIPGAKLTRRTPVVFLPFP